MTVSVITVQGLKMAVQRHGLGPTPLLFIHGLGSNHRCWAEASCHFDLGRYTLYIPDLPGFGLSSKPDNFSYSMEALTACLELAIQQFHIEPLHIIAHSMGGIVGLLWATRNPHLLGSLTLAEGNLVAADAVMSARVAKRSETRFVKNYALWVSQLPSFMTDATVQQQQHFVASLNQTSAIALYRAAKSCAEWSRSERLSSVFASLTCPRAYVVGEKTLRQRTLPDVVTNRSVTLFAVPGQGHFMMEDAKGFYIPLAQWIDSLERSI